MIWHHGGQKQKSITYIFMLKNLYLKKDMIQLIASIIGTETIWGITDQLLREIFSISFLPPCGISHFKIILGGDKKLSGNKQYYIKKILCIQKLTEYTCKICMLSQRPFYWRFGLDDDIHFLCTLIGPYFDKKYYAALLRTVWYPHCYASVVNHLW